MNANISQKINDSALVQIINEAYDAELYRDIITSQKILSAVWANRDANPAIEDFSPLMQAEILRLCGFHLSYYGRARNQKAYQERGKDFLFKAIEIFDKENRPHKSAEAKVMLALCYWYEGGVSESETILSEIEVEYSQNPLHKVSLQICINRLIIHYYKEEFAKGEAIVKKLAELVELSDDWRLVTMYHNQAGLIHHRLKQYGQSIYHYRQAMIVAKRVGSGRFCAINYNNLGYVYIDMGKFALAHENVDIAIKFYSELGEVGWLAHTLDTKALVYLAEGNYDLALKTIDEALSIFWQGEDYAGLVESLYTKTKVLTRLERIQEAIELSGELQEIAKHKIGGFAVKQYTAKLAKLVCAYHKPNTELPDDIAIFDTTGFKIIFNLTKPSRPAFTFKMSGSHLPILQTEADVIVLVEQSKKAGGQTVIVQKPTTKKFICGKLEKDPVFGKFALRINDDDIPMPIDDYKCFGKIIAYSPFNNYKDEIIFQPFE